jgi:hypothetical protein
MFVLFVMRIYEGNLKYSDVIIGRAGALLKFRTRGDTFRTVPITMDRNI